MESEFRYYDMDLDEKRQKIVWSKMTRILSGCEEATESLRLDILVDISDNDTHRLPADYRDIVQNELDNCLTNPIYLNQVLVNTMHRDYSEVDIHEIFEYLVEEGEIRIHG